MSRYTITEEGNINPVPDGTPGSYASATEAAAAWVESGKETLEDSAKPLANPALSVRELRVEFTNNRSVVSVVKVEVDGKAIHTQLHEDMELENLIANFAQRRMS